MDFIDALGFMKEEFDIRSIRFEFSLEEFSLNPEIFSGDLNWSYIDNKEVLSFKVKNNNGIDEFIGKLSSAIYKNYNVVIKLDSNLGSDIELNMYCSKFEYKSDVNSTTLYFYGSLSTESNYKGEVIEYLIE